MAKLGVIAAQQWGKRWINQKYSWLLAIFRTNPTERSRQLSESLSLMTRGLVSAPSSMASMTQSLPQEPGRLAVPPPVANERPAARAEAADGRGPGALRQQGPLRVSAGSRQQQTRRLEYSHTDLFFFYLRVGYIPT